MSYYTTTPLDDRRMSIESGSKCVGYGTGLSHERIILGAGGEIGRDGFMDPRPGHSGEMIADRVFINERNNTIQGINFNKNGEYCCSYTGMDYNDIKDSNRRDCEEKRLREGYSSDRLETTSKTLQRQRSESQPLESKVQKESNNQSLNSDHKNNNKPKH